MATRTCGDFGNAGVAKTAFWLVFFLPAAARPQTTVYGNGNSAWNDAAARSGDAAGTTTGGGAGTIGGPATITGTLGPGRAARAS